MRKKTWITVDSDLESIGGTSDSEQEAKDKAKEHSEENPGEEVFVFVLVGSYKAESVFTEVRPDPGEMWVDHPPIEDYGK